MAVVIVHYQSAVPKSYPPQGQPKSFSDEFLVIFFKFYFRSQMVRLHLNLNKTSRKKKTQYTHQLNIHIATKRTGFFLKFMQVVSQGIWISSLLYFISK